MGDYSKVLHSRRIIALAILCCIPALIAYNPLPLYFLNDDFIHVPLSQKAIWGQRNSIRPFNDLSLYFDSLLWGNEAAGYHLTNLLLHIGCSVLVFFLSIQVMTFLNVERHKKFWSLAAAVFFFGYAFHAEAVFWVIGRTGSLSALFFLVCFIIFLSGYRKWYHIVIAWVVFACALFTYESVWIMPPMLILFYLLFKRYRGAKNIMFIAGFWLLFAFYLYLRNKWTGEVAGNYEGGNINAFHITSLIGNYAKLVMRSFVGPQVKSSVFVISFAVVFCWLVFVCAKWTAKKSFSSSWLLWVFITVFSFLPYVSLGIDTHGVEAERYLYLPSIFICILLCAVFASFKNNTLAIASYLGYFVFNQYFLVKEANAFRRASFVAKTTMHEIQQNVSKQHFYFQNLPKENYGVPIFRLGLEEGVNWLTADSNASKKIRILSFNEDDNYAMRSIPVVQHFDLGQRQSRTYYAKDAKTDVYHLRKELALISPGRDILIVYDAKSIKVFR